METKLNEHGRSIKEDELHAYVDNQPDVARRLPAGELYLHEHPDEARGKASKPIGGSAPFYGRMAKGRHPPGSK